MDLIYLKDEEPEIHFFRMSRSQIRARFGSVNELRRSLVGRDVDRVGYCDDHPRAEINTSLRAGTFRAASRSMDTKTEADETTTDEDFDASLALIARAVTRFDGDFAGLYHLPFTRAQQELLEQWPALAIAKKIDVLLCLAIDDINGLGLAILRALEPGEQALKNFEPALASSSQAPANTTVQVAPFAGESSAVAPNSAPSKRSAFRRRAKRSR